MFVKVIWYLISALAVIEFIGSVEPQIELEYYPANSEIPEVYKDKDYIPGTAHTVIKISNIEETKVKLLGNTLSTPNNIETVATIYPDNPLKIKASSSQFLPGEPQKVRITALKGGFDQEVTVYPHPIYDTNAKGSIIIEAQLATLNPVTYFIRITGFEEGEKFLMTMKNCGEFGEIENEYKQNKSIAYSPLIDGILGGIAELEITRRNGESYHLNLPWGAEFLQYKTYVDSNGNLKKMSENREILKKLPQIAEYYGKKKNK